MMAARLTYLYSSWFVAGLERAAKRDRFRGGSCVARCSITSTEAGQQKNQRRHSWVAVATGRVCTECMKTQATNEFDDTPDCPGPRKLGR